MFLGPTVSVKPGISREDAPRDVLEEAAVEPLDAGVVEHEAVAEQLLDHPPIRITVPLEQDPVDLGPLTSISQFPNIFPGRY